MSVDTMVYLRDARLPTRAAWQKALDAAQSGVVLDDVDDIRVHSGFWPAKLAGATTGFEWFYEEADNPPDGTGDRKHVATFITRGDLRELACALFAAGTLAQCADGLYYEEDSDSLVPGTKAIEAAREVVKAGPA